MEELTKQLTQLRMNYNQYKLETENKIKTANRIINEHLPFIDSSKYTVVVIFSVFKVCNLLVLL